MPSASELKEKLPKIEEFEDKWGKAFPLTFLSFFPSFLPSSLPPFLPSFPSSLLPSFLPSFFLS